MLTIFYENGSKRVIRVAPAFFTNKKGDASPHSKAQDITNDLGGVRYTLESIKK